MTKHAMLKNMILKAGALILASLILMPCVPVRADGDGEEPALELLLPEEKTPFAWRLTDDDPDSRINSDVAKVYGLSSISNIREE